MRISAFLLVAACAAAQTNYRNWDTFGGSSENIHYSSLKQINTKNVQKIKVAWTFDSGDAYPGSDIQCNPIVVNGVMYATTPRLRVVALDAATGKQIWMLRWTAGSSAESQESRTDALDGWEGIPHSVLRSGTNCFRSTRRR